MTGASNPVSAGRAGKIAEMFVLHKGKNWREANRLGGRGRLGGASASPHPSGGGRITRNQLFGRHAANRVMNCHPRFACGPDLLIARLTDPPALGRDVVQAEIHRAENAEICAPREGYGHSDDSATIWGLVANCLARRRRRHVWPAALSKSAASTIYLPAPSLRIPIRKGLGRCSLPRLGSSRPHLGRTRLTGST